MIGAALWILSTMFVLAVTVMCLYLFFRYLFLPLLGIGALIAIYMWASNPHPQVKSTVNTAPANAHSKGVAQSAPTSANSSVPAPKPADNAKVSARPKPAKKVAAWVCDHATEDCN